MANPVITTAADVAGRALSAVTGTIATLRSSDKPLHPEGTLYAGRLVRTGSDDPIGVPWLDQPGEENVMVRTSHAVGLPGPIPDIDGLAIRMRKGQTRYADVLLASTGWDPLTRHVLRPAWSSHQPLTTLLPYRSPIGPIVIGALPIDTGQEVRGHEMFWAPIGKSWRRLGELHLEMALPEETEVSFDPVLNPIPGLEQYAWVEHLRERSYAVARRLRREDQAATTH